MCWVFFIRTIPIGVTYTVCIDTSGYTQVAAGDQSIVWLLVSTSHIGHHQDDCIKRSKVRSPTARYSFCLYSCSCTIVLMMTDI
jgi:hypothetical protein